MSTTTPAPPSRRWALWAGLGFVAVVGLGAFVVTKPFARPPETVIAARRDLVEAVEVSGVAESSRRVALKARASGLVRTLDVPVNGRAAAGAVLLALDGEQAQAALRQALSNRDAAVRQAQVQGLTARRTLAEAQGRLRVAVRSLELRLTKARAALGQLDGDLGRARALAAEGGVSRQALEQQAQQRRQAQLDVGLALDELARARSATEIVAARNAIAVADASLASATQQGGSAVALARRTVADTRLLAPFPGVVTDWTVEVGDTVAPGTPLGTFQDLDTLRVRLPVDELDLPKMRVGGSVDLVFDAYPEAPVRGSIARVSRASVDGAANVRVYPVEVRFKDPGGRIAPGMSCDASVIVRRLHDVVAIPTGALLREGGRATVQVLGARNQVEVRAVEPGLETLDAVEVRAGLQPGDRVVYAASGAK